MNKKDLYKRMDGVRDALGIGYDCMYANPFDMCSKLDIQVICTEFVTSGLRGIAIPSTGPTRDSDTIILNGKRDFTQRKFDCAHELTHLLLHAPSREYYLQQVDDVTIAQDGYTEWEANEGAAELLMPYRIFIPMFVLETKAYKSETVTCRRMARLFKVTEQNIAFRMKGLQYEIWQYANGTAIADLVIMSRSEQKAQGIQLPDDFSYIHI